MKVLDRIEFGVGSCIRKTSGVLDPSARKCFVSFLILSMFLLASGTTLAAEISGNVWQDINADALNGDATNNVLGTNVLTQGDTSQTGDLGTNTYGDPAVIDAGVEDGYESVEVCLSGDLTVPNPAAPPATTVESVDRCDFTNTDGNYVFDLSDIDPTSTGVGDLTISFTATPGFKFSSQNPSNDNDADEQASAPVPPDPWTATIPLTGYDATNGDVTDGTDAGLRPLPEIILGYVDLNANSGDGIQGIETGTPAYNQFGNCTNADPLDPTNNENPEPGDDCARYDDYVRTNDLVTLTPSITLDNSPAGGVDDIVLEMQFSPNDGAEIEIVSPSASGIPTACLTSGVNPVSQVINNPDGSIKLVCNLGNIQDAQLFAPISIKPTGNSPDGSSFDTEIRAYAANNDALPSEELPVPEIGISAVPQFDLTKNSGSATSPPNRVINAGNQLLRTNTVTGVSELGKAFRYDVSIVAGGDGRGSAALGDTLTLSEYIDPRYAAFGAIMYFCEPNPYPVVSTLPTNGGGALPYDDAKTADNGTWSCPAGTTAVTISDADTSGNHYPSEAQNGNATAPWKYVITGQIRVWYPFSAFYRFAGPDKMLGTADDGTLDGTTSSVGSTPAQWTNLWQPGDTVATGTYPITNCVGNFDPNSIPNAQGAVVSNYGTGFEPGWDGTTPTGNNCRNHSYTISLTGSFTKRFAGDINTVTGDGKFDDAPTWSWACTGTPDQEIVPGQTACDTGDGPVVAGQNVTAEVFLSAESSQADLSNPWLCETIDNSTYRLAPIVGGSAAGEYAWLSYNDRVAPAPNGGATTLGYVFGTDYGFILEYARFTASSSRSTWQVNHAAGPPNVIDGSIPVDNSQQQLAAKDCGVALTDTNTIEWSQDPQADGWSADDLVMVRTRPDPTAVPQQVIGAGDRMILNVNFEARDTFYSPDFPLEDGQPMTSGVIFPNVSNFAYDRSNDPRPVDFGTGGYNATSHAGADGSRTVSHGDRFIYQTVNVAIEKEAYNFFNTGSSPGDNDLFEEFAGDPLMWSLHPSVFAINANAMAQDVTITDVLPVYTTYSAACSPPLPAGVSGPQVIPNTPNVGETTLIYTYDSPLAANSALEPISICTNTDPFAPAPVDVVNNVKIEASNVAFVPSIQEDDRAVRLLQIGRFAVQKTVDFPLDFQNDEQVWSLIWANTSDQIPFSPPEIVDVFPFIGDGPGALAEREQFQSDFAGDLVLTAIPDVPVITGGVISPRADSGQWYATCDDPTTVNPDASNAVYNDIDPSTAVVGTTNWVAVAAGSSAAPNGACALADVTALRWVSEDNLLAQETGQADVSLLASMNDPNDLYVNRFTAYTTTFLDSPVRSNEPFVRVIGFSLGDLIWLDVDENGVFNAGTDIPAPAGVTVNLFEQTAGMVDSTMTDADGRWFFEALTGDQISNPGSNYVAGQYYVEVTGLPTGWVVDGASTTFSADPNSDLNEDEDHHSLLDMGSTIRSSGVIELSATITPNGLITGDEPTGDNIEFIGDPAIRDDLTNFTLDLMLVPSRGDILVTKQMIGGGSLDGWIFSLIPADPANCPLPVGLTNPGTTDDAGEVLFLDLIEYNVATGEKCDYNITETPRVGWTLDSLAPAGPYNVDSIATLPLAVTATNVRDTGSIAVTKTVVGADAPAGWTFTLTSSTTDCSVPVPASMTTTEGSGGTVTFIDIPTHTATIDPMTGMAAQCMYGIAETAQTGWTQTTSPGDLTDLTVVSGETTEVEVENRANPLQAQVTKTVTGVETGLDWAFIFSLAPTDITQSAPTVSSSDAIAEGIGAQTSTDVVTWDGIQPGIEYIMTETAAAGYASGNLMCTGAGVTQGVSAPGMFTFTAAPTDDTSSTTLEIVCTIQNDAQSVQAQISKTVAGVDTSIDWSFGFSLAPAATLTSADAIVSGIGNGTSLDVVTWDNLVPGTQYVLTETVTAGYQVTTDLACTGITDLDSVSNTVTFIAPLGDASNTTYEVACAITNTAYGADLQVTKDVLANDTLDWSFEFTLTPDNTTVVDASPATGTGSASDTVSWSDLVPGTQYTLAETSLAGFTASALSCTGIDDLDQDAENASVTFVAPFGDANDPSITFEVVCSITNSQDPDVSVIKVASPLVIDPTGMTTFTITASNIGYLDATMLELTDLLPAGLEVDSSVASIGSFDEGSGIWTIGTLTRTTPATLTLVTSAEPLAGKCSAQPYVNAVSVTSQGEIDFNPADNSASASVNVASIGLAKRLSDDSPIELDNGLYQVTYELMLTNTGLEDVEGLQIVDDLSAMIDNPNPNGATFMVTNVVSPDLTLSPNSAGFDGIGDTNILLGTDTLAVGATGRVNVTFELTPAAYFGPFINTAQATGNSVERVVDGPNGPITYPSVALVDDSEDGDMITTDPCIYASPTPLLLSTPSNPITLGWFKSESSGGGVLFSWKTELEISNAGFFLSVQDSNGEWQQINHEMIASQGDSTKVQNYTYLAERVSGTTFRITDVSVHGKLKHHGPFTLGQQVGASVDRKSTDWNQIQRESDQREAEREQQRQIELQRRLDNLAPQGNRDDKSQVPAYVKFVAALFGSMVAPTHAADLLNFEITEAGIYRVDHANLVANGLDLSGVDVSRIGLESGNVQVPVRIETNGLRTFSVNSYIEFPAHGNRTLYSGVNQYTLTIDEGQSLIVDNTDAVPYKGAATSYLAEAVYAPQNKYTYLSPDVNDSWYAERLLAIGGPVQTTVNLVLTEKANVLSLPSSFRGNQGQGVEEKPTLKIDLWGGSALPGNGLTNPDHHVLVSLNGQEVVNEKFDGLRVSRIEQPLASVAEGGNNITINLPMDHGYNFDIVNIDSVALSYARRFVAMDNGTNLAFKSTWDKFRIRGLASDQVTVYRVDANNQGLQMNSRGVEAADVSSCGSQGCMVVFAGSNVGEESQYFVATDSGKKLPDIKVAPLASDLFSGKADALIVAHPDFIDTNGQLLESYASDLTGIYGSVDIVSTESIYAAYSGHVQDAYAIASYIQDAYVERNSRHLILVGGDTYDYHNNLQGGAQSFVPSLYVQVAQNVNAVPSDAKYGDVDGDSIPDMTVTRLPVRTVTELASLLTKRQDYLTKTYSSNAVFAADKVDSSSYSFKNDALDVITGYLSDWDISPAYMDDMDLVSGTDVIRNSINAGVALTSFFGHSSTDRWSLSGLFTGEDAANLTNFGRPTVVAQWGCWNTFYVSPEEDSMAHRLLVEGEQGAVVVMGASSLTKAGAEKRMAELLFERLTQGMRIGDAVLSAKQAFAEENPYQLDILLGWAVLGPSDLIVH